MGGASFGCTLIPTCLALALRLHMFPHQTRSLNFQLRPIHFLTIFEYGLLGEDHLIGGPATVYIHWIRPCSSSNPSSFHLFSGCWLLLLALLIPVSRSARGQAIAPG